MEQEKTGREIMEEIRNRRLYMNDMLRAVADVVDGYDYDYCLYNGVKTLAFRRNL